LFVVVFFHQPHSLTDDDRERAVPAVKALAGCLYTGGGFTRESLPQDCTPFREAAIQALFHDKASDDAADNAIFSKYYGKFRKN
jgi:hypothetical protein